MDRKKLLKVFGVAVLLATALLPVVFSGASSLNFYETLPVMLLIMVPAFALSLLSPRLRLIERLAITASAGLILVPSLAFVCNKLSVPLGWPVTLVFVLPSVAAIWKLRGGIDLGLDHWDAMAIFAAVLLMLVYVAPVLNDPAPYGAYDAAFHWSVSDLIAEKGSVFSNYPTWNTIYPGQPYGQPPAVHVGAALLAILHGDSGPVTMYVYYGFIILAFVLGTFSLVRRLYGPIAALGAIVAAMTVYRFFTVMLYGQWPSLAALAMLPVALVAARLYLQEPDRRHAALLGLLLGLSAWAHTLIAAQNVVVVGLYVLLESWRLKRFPQNILPLALCLLIGLPVFLLPQAMENAANQSLPLYLLYPPAGPEGRFGTYSSWWTDPLQVYGPAVLAAAALGVVAFLKRRREDLLPLAFALSLFLLYHSPWLSDTRIMRFTIAEGLFMAILVGLGLTVFQNIGRLRRFEKPAALVLLVLLVSYQAVWSAALMKGYAENRITSKQFELLESLKGLPDGSFTYLGFASTETVNWLQLAARHQRIDLVSNVSEESDTLHLSIPPNVKYILLTNSTQNSDRGTINNLISELGNSGWPLLYSNSEGVVYEIEYSYTASVSNGK